MAKCPPELLDELAEVLDEIRTWPDVVERKPGVFYVRTQPFLHFHALAKGGRRGDVKGIADWTEVDLPEPTTAASRRELLRALRASYAERRPGAKAARSAAPAKRATSP